MDDKVVPLLLAFGLSPNECPRILEGKNGISLLACNPVRDIKILLCVLDDESIKLDHIA